ncbi:hypothetical protein BDY24DRAFT_400104 [Mrakia frigida]|uniref:uncharacterized protein n=1 Tax=Mrakia frigida TaxID=29902 RepID=UPI003FCC0111
MLPSLLAASLLLLSPALVSSQFVFQGFFPILSPSSSQGWILGETNTLSWSIGISNQLPGSFDVTMIDPTSLNGPLRLLAQVPLNALSVPLALAETGIPEGENYRLTFYDSWSGQVFAQSDKFSVVAKGSASPPSPPSYPTTATVTGFGAQYAATLAGPHLPTGTDTDTGKVLGTTSDASPLLLTSALGLVVAGLGLGVVGVWAA